MADPAIIDKFYQKFAYVSLDEINDLIESEPYEKRNSISFENRLKVINDINRYNTESESGDVDDEIHRLDMCRDEKILDAILPTFPTPICRIIVKYGVMTPLEIVTRISSDVSNLIRSSRISMTYDRCCNAIVRFSIIDPSHCYFICNIELYKESANLINVSFHQIINFDRDAYDNIKNQTIGAARTMTTDKNVIAICVKTIMLWRGWTM